MWGEAPTSRGGGWKQSLLSLGCFCAYIGGRRGSSPHPKPPVPTCGPPRLLGGFKGLSRINISSAVVFYCFVGDFLCKNCKNRDGAFPYRLITKKSKSRATFRIG